MAKPSFYSRAGEAKPKREFTCGEVNSTLHQSPRGFAARICVQDKSPRVQNRCRQLRSRELKSFEASHEIRSSPIIRVFLM